MTFKEKLNEYMKRIGCTSKALSECTYISQSVISRYRRNDEQKPDEKRLESIANGIAVLAEKAGIDDITADAVLSDFNEIFKQKAADSEQFITDINSIIKALHINYRLLAEFMNINISFLYRLTNGSRNIKNPEKFADELCRYIIRFHSTDSDMKIISELTGVIVNSGENIYSAIYNRLLPTSECVDMKNDTAHDFLSKMDSFDLNEFISGFDFNKSDIPISQETKKPSAGNYYGIEQFKKAELDFIRKIFVSDSKKSVFMFSNMPMSDMAKDIEFSKKWMVGLAMIMRKGMNINIIHNLDRPVNEMMLGLISWIPLYMTGQVSSHFFRNFKDNTFCHLYYVAENAVLTGECVSGFHENGRYCLTDSAEDIAYYQEKSKHILSKAEPLMEVYKVESAEKYQEFYKKYIIKKCNRRNILCSLPMYTVSDELLERMFKHNSLIETEKKKIFEYVAIQRKETEELLKNNIITDEIPNLSEEMFEQNPLSLFLADIFFEKKISYTYQEYREHFDMTVKFAEKNKNYFVKKIPFFTFKNIQIYICGNGESVKISKYKSPAIHFVMHHPKLCKAIDNMIICE